MSRVVTPQEIESLPISGRNFVDFVKLSSGVATGRENVGGGAFKEPDVGVGSAAAPRLSSPASPSSTRMVQVDGADNVQTFTGLPRRRRHRRRPRSSACSTPHTSRSTAARSAGSSTS